MGHEFQFRTNPIPILNYDGVFHCKVLEIVPYKKLSYSWNGRITRDTLVVWKLQAKDKGTELLLEHSGFSKEENFAIYTGMTVGWVNNVYKIVAHLKKVQRDTTSSIAG